MRAHLLKTLTDSTGAVLLNSTVRILQPGTTTLLTDTLWSDDTTVTVPVSNPSVIADGVVDFYLDVSQRVRIGVTPSGDSEVFFEDIDVLEPVTSASSEYITLTDVDSVVWYVTIDTTGHLSTSTTAP